MVARRIVILAGGIMALIEINRPVLNRRLEFDSADEVLKFLEQEIELWRWIDTPTIHPQVVQLIGGFRTGWTGPIETAARGIKERPDDPALVEQLKSLLGQRFRNRFEWCSHDEEPWQVNEIAKQDPEAAGVALAVLTGRDRQLEEGSFEARHSYRVGRSKGYAILAGLDPKALEAASSSVIAVKDGALKDANAVRDILANTQTNTREALQQIQTDAHSQHQAIAEGNEQTLKAQQEAFDKLKVGLEGITAAYEAQMQLQGPVKYWEDRAAKYQKKYRNAGWVLGLYSLVAAIALFCLYSVAASHLPAEGGAIPYAALFKSTAFALLMTTIVFWAGRILLRIYLGSYHLASDADERRTISWPPISAHAQNRRSVIYQGVAGIPPASRH